MNLIDRITTFLFGGYFAFSGVVEELEDMRRDAEQGDAAAQSGLGFMYRYGLGVPQDYVKAYMWMDLAATGKKDQDETVQKFCVSIATKMTPAEIDEAQRLVQARMGKRGD